MMLYFFVKVKFNQRVTAFTIWGKTTCSDSMITAIKVDPLILELWFNGIYFKLEIMSSNLTLRPSVMDFRLKFIDRWDKKDSRLQTACVSNACWYPMFIFLRQRQMPSVSLSVSCCCQKKLSDKKKKMVQQRTVSNRQCWLSAPCSLPVTNVASKWMWQAVIL